ncbi:amino acid ABC transporter permease [Mesotoga sp. UBA6090]|uniref:amino acid ABC transporter permease n=1 Tax=Mesotoga sp. UBA6090 TaxID=1946860 RepID=UPI0025F3FE07|nr:amino acid ABC transporter permease [Mesotoga sp. UBA6090]
MSRAMSKITLGIIVAGLLWFSYSSVSAVYPFNWSTLTKYYKLFLDGIVTTLQLSVIALALAVIVGIAVALARDSKVNLLRDAGTLYVWFFRNMPLLVIILLVYYGFGSAVNVDRFWAGVISLSLFEGAYVGEIFRAGIDAVPSGEKEAGEAMGLYKSQIMFSIVFPQAFRISIPPLIGQLVTLIKDSSLVSVIALGDLTMKARQVGTQTLAVFEAYILLAACYLVMTSLVSLVGRILERKLAIP